MSWATRLCRCEHEDGEHEDDAGRCLALDCGCRGFTLAVEYAHQGEEIRRRLVDTVVPVATESAGVSLPPCADCDGTGRGEFDDPSWPYDFEKPCGRCLGTRVERFPCSAILRPVARDPELDETFEFGMMLAVEMAENEGDPWEDGPVP